MDECQRPPQGGSTGNPAVATAKTSLEITNDLHFWHLLVNQNKPAGAQKLQ